MIELLGSSLATCAGAGEPPALASEMGFGDLELDTLHLGVHTILGVGQDQAGRYVGDLAGNMN